MNHSSLIRNPKILGRLCRFLMIGVLLYTCLQPTLSIAATLEPPQQQEEESNITLLNIALFYAALIGIVVGAATGWVALFFYYGGPENSPVTPAEAEK